MEKKHIKQSFLGFSHEVKPIQKVFHDECADADLNSDVLQIFSELQKSLIGGMMKGACALTRLRNSDDITPEDLLCHLDTQWKIDPLLVSENYYKVNETTEKVDLSVPTKPLPKKKRISSCNNAKKTASKPKISAKKLKMAEAHRKTLEICRRVVFKIPFDDLIKPKPETQTSNILNRPDIIEFFGKKHKRYNFDCLPGPSQVATTYKCKSKIEKNVSTCESIMKVHPSKENAEFEFKVLRPHTEPLTESKQSEESNKSTSMFLKKELSFSSRMEVGFSAEQTGSELNAEKQPSIKTSFQNGHLVMPGTILKQMAAGVDTIFKQPSKELICGPKSKIGEKITTCNILMKVSPSKNNSESEIKVSKQPPVEMHSFKMSVNVKQEKSVECAFDENRQLEKQPSIKLPCKNLKRKDLGFTDVPGETPEEARKRLAIILLRIAGKYPKDVI